MKKGDLVIIDDYSYSKVVEIGCLVDVADRSSKQFIVVETNCKFPPTHENQRERNRFNDTVIQAIGSGEIVFIEERFLKLVTPKHEIMIDGKTIEISHESYENIKKAIGDYTLLY